MDPFDTERSGWDGPDCACCLPQVGAILARVADRILDLGKLGVVEAGAYADLLLVDGGPTRELALIGDPDARFRVIMMNGQVHKNTL